MGSRNTFVTSFVYSPDAMQVVEKALQDIDAEYYRPRDAELGFFAGILKTIGEPPNETLDALFDVIDKGFAGCGYDTHFDIAVVCDDARIVMQRNDRFGFREEKD